jgi:hypothetical protein
VLLAAEVVDAVAEAEAVEEPQLPQPRQKLQVVHLPQAELLRRPLLHKVVEAEAVVAVAGSVVVQPAKARRASTGLNGIFAKFPLLSRVQKPHRLAEEAVALADSAAVLVRS